MSTKKSIAKSQLGPECELWLYCTVNTSERWSYISWNPLLWLWVCCSKKKFKWTLEMEVKQQPLLKVLTSSSLSLLSPALLSSSFCQPTSRHSLPDFTYHHLSFAVPLQQLEVPGFPHFLPSSYWPACANRWVGWTVNFSDPPIPTLDPCTAFVSTVEGLILIILYSTILLGRKINFPLPFYVLG